MKLKKHIDATLGSGNLREVVRLPVGEDVNEWLAVNSKFLHDSFSLTVVAWRCSGCLKVSPYICNVLARISDDICLQLLTSSIK
jgi:hypothetical protein